MKHKNQMRMIFDALEENVAIARITCASFAAQYDFTLTELEEIKVAVSEAVSNAVIHAYPEQEGKVELVMELGDSCIVYEVRDFGVGIADIDKAREPDFSSQTERMGMGFVFMESFMDSVIVESEVEKGTVVRMMKSCTAITVQ
ncbi:MAG: anti-sigma F factor [Selenomonadales bacterium]|nr:anti-sigma F factor [Selenomonadales bacterium]